MAHVYTTTSPWQLAATSSNNDKDRPCYHYDDDDDDEEGGAHARHALGAADGVTSAVRLSRHIPQREQMNMAVAAYNLLECHDKPRRHVDDGGRCYSGMDDDSCHGGSDSSHHRYISAGDDKVVVVVGNCYGILPFSPDTTTSPLPLSSSSSSSSRSSVTEYAAVSATTTGSDGGDDCNEDSNNNNNSSSSRSNAAPAVARMMTTSAHTPPSLLATSASSLSASTYTSLSESFMSDDSSYVTSVYNDMLAEQLAGPRDRNSNNSYSRSSHTMRGCCGSAAVVTAPTVSNTRCLWHTGLAHSNHDMHATNNGDNNEAKGEDDNDNDDDDDDDVARVRAIAAQCTHRLGGSGSVLDLHPRMGNVYGSGHSSTTAVAGGDAYCRGVCRRTAQDHVNAHTSASMLPLSGQRRATPPPQQQQRSRQAAHAAPLPWPSSRATRPAFVTRRYASMRTAAVTTTTATMATAVGSSSSSSSSNGGGSGVARAAARARWLPSNPECVLDAPELPCDAGQQVLDWARCHDTLAIGLGHTVYTWQPQTRQSCKLVELDASTRVRGVRWLHHDACVAISAVDEAVVVVHDARRQGLLRRVRLGSECGAAANGATAVVTAMAVHGPLLAVASDGVGGAIDVFDLRAREARVCTHYTHRGAVASLAYCAAEPFYLASGGRDDDDGGVCVWDVRRPTEPRYRLDHLHRGSVSALLWHPTRRSRLLTGGGVDGVLCYINTHAPLRTLDARVSGDGGGCGVGVGGGDDGYADEVNTGYVVAQEDGGDDGDVAMSRDDHHADSSVTATRTPLPLSYAARHATWRARRGDGGTSDTAVHMLTRAVNTLHPITGIACCDGDRDSAAVLSRPHAYGRDEGDDEGGRSGSSGVLRGAAGGGGAAALPRKTGDIVVTSHKSTGQLQLRRVCDFRLHGVLRTHASEADMTCLSMSADQQRVCVAQSDETLTFWRVATAAASGPTSRMTTAACSAGARGCYSCGSGSTAASQTACGVAHYNDVTHMLLDDEQAPRLR